MYVKCEKCGRTYDDAARWTICPHGPLGAAYDDYCPKCDIVGAWQGPCEHLKIVPASPAKEYARTVITGLAIGAAGAIVYHVLYRLISWFVGPLF